MGKEKNEEQEFLRNIESFLNGEESVPGEDAGEDARSAIEFAKKLTELRADPSPEFQEGLKSKLLRKLTEQEMAARENAGASWFGGFWNRLVPQNPVWRTAVVTVAVLVVAVGVIWRTGIFTMSGAPGETEETAGENGRSFEESAASDSQKDWSQNGITAAGEEEESTLTIPPSGAEDGVLNVEIEIPSSDEITIIIEPIITQYGTEITLTLTFRNTGSEIVTIDPTKTEIIVKGLDDELVYTLPTVDGPAELSPSESFQMSYIWEQQDNSGSQVPAGTYHFNIGSIIITCGTTSGELTPPPAEVVILEPE